MKEFLNKIIAKVNPPSPRTLEKLSYETPLSTFPDTFGIKSTSQLSSRSGWSYISDNKLA